MADALTQLRALLAEATAGPWRTGAGDPFHEPEAIVCASGLEPGLGERILFRANYYFPSENDIALVIAIRAALPALLDVVEAARATLETADNWLSDFDGGGARREALNDTLDALESALGSLDRAAGPPPVAPGETEATDG